MTTSPFLFPQKSPPTLGHPQQRLRRLRMSPGVRALVQENTLLKKDFIVPLFVHNNSNRAEPISSLPGIERIALSELGNTVKSLEDLGAKGLLLFAVNPASTKTPDGREAWNPRGLLAQAITAAKKAAPQLVIFADVALDPFTTHGHDGIVDDAGEILNDETVGALCQMSICLAQAGVDFVAPSDMMDGRTLAIRMALDGAGFKNTGILAYSAKYASAFYGPFREAVQSGARGLDKRTYQLEPHNRRPALQEALFDAAEGADMIMVKPALCYLDVIAAIRPQIHIPLVAYHVSGEYCMLKAAAANGWIDEEAAALECLLSIKRAGADLIVSYYAKWFLENFANK